MISPEQQRHGEAEFSGEFVFCVGPGGVLLAPVSVESLSSITTLRPRGEHPGHPSGEQPAAKRPRRCSGTPGQPNSAGPAACAAAPGSPQATAASGPALCVPRTGGPQDGQAAAPALRGEQQREDEDDSSSAAETLGRLRHDQSPQGSHAAHARGAGGPAGGGRQEEEGDDEHDSPAGAREALQEDAAAEEVLQRRRRLEQLEASQLRWRRPPRGYTSKKSVADLTGALVEVPGVVFGLPAAGGGAAAGGGIRARVLGPDRDHLDAVVVRTLDDNQRCARV